MTANRTHPRREAGAIAPVRLLPDLNIVKIGATSILEAGRDIAMQVIEEVAELAGEHQLLLTAGGGERHRHIFTVGVDLGMPTGVLAVLAGNTPMQNALILQALLAPYGGIRIPPDHFDELPVYLAAGSIPITSGMPTYDYWERPPAVGDLPQHDTDLGAYLLGETLGARSVVLVKDVDGVYSADPKIEPDAKLFEEVTVDELLDAGVETLPFDEPILDNLRNARSVTEIRIVNGRRRGQLTAALEGKPVGTVVRAR